MTKKYIIKRLSNQKYYCGESLGWNKKAFFADHFDTIEDAEAIIDQEYGTFQIESIYVVKQRTKETLNNFKNSI